jgi:hypothetical protein
VPSIPVLIGPQTPPATRDCGGQPANPRSTSDGISTPEVIARHLHSDQRLTRNAAEAIAGLVEEMYHRLAGEQPRMAVHLRSARTFTPATGILLADILSDMQADMLAPPEQ